MKRVARLLPLFAVLAAQVAVASETPPSFLLQWGSPGPGNGEFAYPRGVATDVAGNVYIADQNNDRIQKFTNNGVYVSQWGTFGTGNGEFEVPEDLAIGPNGHLYVLEAGNSRVQELTGVDLAAEPEGPPPEIVLEWRA